MVDNASGDVTIIGGGNASFANGIISGERETIYYGAGITESSTVWPSATIAIWESFIASATNNPVP
ncbi:MAG TPA: hypothetical protein VGO47_10490 [Chlamydiales bacterium]|nr:hypothetical protein [Chlamydiales bacterium]